MEKLYLSKVIKIAENELDYYEKASNYKLYDKYANKGSNNYTKYNYELVNKIGNPYYNPAEWCDMFVDWCICTALEWDIERAKQALNGFSAYCPTSAQYYRNVNRWYNIPKVGRQFFVGYKGHEEHTGFVYKVLSNNVFKTIEGNKNNKVCIVTRYVSQCSGFGEPDYDYYDYKEDNKLMVKTSLVKYGSVGENVKTIQRIYNAYFHREMEVDGKCGNLTVIAIKELQKALNIEVDGICGENTWNSIINELS